MILLSITLITAVPVSQLDVGGTLQGTGTRRQGPVGTCCGGRGGGGCSEWADLHIPSTSSSL